MLSERIVAKTSVSNSVQFLPLVRALLADLLAAARNSLPGGFLVTFRCGLVVFDFSIFNDNFIPRMV